MVSEDRSNELLPETENVQNRVNKEGANPNKDNLFSKVIKHESNTYFIDVRSNDRGKFLKVTERRPKDRQTVILSGRSVGDLKNVLEKAIASNSHENEADEEGNWKTLTTSRLSYRNKTLYFDIMVNKYGRSLNIAEVSQKKGKSAVIVAEQCWLQFQRALSEILEEYAAFFGPRPQRNSKMLKSKKFALKAKTVFMDLLQNDLGKLVKLSELRKNRRETLFIPMICFEPIIELLNNLQAENYNGEVHGMQNLELPEPREGSDLVFLSKKELVLEGEEDVQPKRFNYEYRSNSFGKFLKMTEFREVGKPSSVFLPEDSFDEVKECLADFLNFEED